MEKLSKFHLAIKGLIIHNNKLLLLKKPAKPDHDIGYWELPGGGLGFGEMPESTLEREIMEEVCLKVTVIKPLLVWSFIKNIHTQVIGITYLCKSDSPQVKLSPEHVEFKWVTPSDLNHLDILPELKEDMDKLVWTDIIGG